MSDLSYSEIVRFLVYFSGHIMLEKRTENMWSASLILFLLLPCCSTMQIYTLTTTTTTSTTIRTKHPFLVRRLLCNNNNNNIVLIDVRTHAHTHKFKYQWDIPISIVLMDRHSMPFAHPSFCSLNRQRKNLIFGFYMHIGLFVEMRVCACVSWFNFKDHRKKNHLRSTSIYTR